MASRQPVAEHSKARGRKAFKASEPEEWLPIEEIELRYPNEWVLAKIDAPHKPDSERRGVVLAHHPSLKRIAAASVRVSRENPTISTYLFTGGKRPRTREELDEVIANAAGMGIIGYGWR